MFNAPNAETCRERILPAESGLNGKEWQMSRSVGLITTMIETMVAWKYLENLRSSLMFGEQLDFKSSALNQEFNAGINCLLTFDVFEV